MRNRAIPCIMTLLSVIGLAGCFSTTSQKMKIAAPLPPLSDSAPALADFNTIQPATGLAMNAGQGESRQSCSFSSFQRKNTVGYQLDESRHISFKASPSFDIFDPSDVKVKFGLRFTKSLGGPANKRPDCIYGSGYYGLLPYVMNNKINLNGFADKANVKSFVEDKLKEREKRQKERDKNNNLYSL